MIGLREGLEAALVVGILLAYIRKTQRTHLLAPMWAGVSVAVLLSLSFGALLTFGPQTLTFEAQEAIGGSLSIISVGFVTWMIFWMAENARMLSDELKGKLDAVQTSVWAVVLLAALSVGCEGLETTLFIWSATRTAGQEANAIPMLGALVGIAIAVVRAWGMMRGMMRINLSRFFTITGAFLVIVAAGVLSYGIHDLQEAAILPGLNNIAFESYRYIDPSSFVGTLLKAVFNLSSTTTWLEAGAWILYVGIVMPLFIRAQRPGLKASAKKPEDEKAAA
ncbi:iron uptake transporter permease EfeU [Rothia sp. RSM292]|uniref:iron uptake transporter permease EfeU n=1 Tax=Rothia sp. RSM292 TaxID=3030212 RepID=UPI00244BFB21|nr:iron uptake transporter permease EfeU [Rothia sp. RSM292]